MRGRGNFGGIGDDLIDLILRLTNVYFIFSLKNNLHVLLPTLFYVYQMLYNDFK